MICEYRSNPNNIMNYYATKSNLYNNTNFNVKCEFGIIRPQWVMDLIRITQSYVTI